jgi:GxGYxYP putative glycoside hydrolase C-terminal domain
LFYMGDYDSAAWLQHHVPKFWNDPAHGDTLCVWAFNPNLKGRAPHAMHYARTRQSANDWFIAGDSGAGYLNPGMLLAPRMDPDLPDGLDAWVRYNKPFFEQFDISITGFVIDGHSPGMGERGMDAYMQFSPDGMVAQKIPAQGLHRDTMPYVRMKTDLYAPPEEAGHKIASFVGLSGPRFNVIRTILKSPTYHKEVMAKTLENPGGDKIRFVDPYTFFLLLKTHERNAAAGATAKPRQAVQFTAPDTRDGASPVAVTDGPYETAEVEGKAALHQGPGAQTTYLYFEVSEGLTQALRDAPGAGVTVTVEVYAKEAGRLGLQYDSQDEPYTNTEPQTLSAGKWTEVTFHLPKAAFTHTQNAGADFRIVNFGLDLAAAKVHLDLTE